MPASTALTPQVVGAERSQEANPLRSRLTAYDWLSSLVFQPIGYALAGVVAAHVLGIDGTLWLAAAWALASSAAVVGLPSIRTLEAAPASGRA